MPVPIPNSGINLKDSSIAPIVSINNVVSTTFLTKLTTPPILSWLKDSLTATLSDKDTFFFIIEYIVDIKVMNPIPPI